MQGLYDGVRGNDGTQLLPGWPRGAEMQLTALVMGPTPFPVAMDYFQKLVHGNDAAWDWTRMDYSAESTTARSYGADILDVPADGLKAFFARGGKLLLSHGWNDGLIPATNTLAFHHGLYNALTPAQAQSQLRLFMAPGMDHCSGGEGPSEFDTLGAIDAWASTGNAPQTLIANRPVQSAGLPGEPPAPPRTPMQRPLCPYPAQAFYKGSGDTALASSFECRVPSS
jgi:hypothetical protein